MIHIYQTKGQAGEPHKTLSNQYGKANLDCSWEEFLKRISQMSFKNRAQGLDRLHSHKITTSAPVRESRVIPWTKAQEAEITDALSRLIVS